MTDNAKSARKQYYQKYQQKNRKKLNTYQRNWRAENPDKVKQYNQNYWERKAQLLCAGV